MNVEAYNPPHIQPANQQSTDTNTLPHTPVIDWTWDLSHPPASIYSKYSRGG